MRKVSIQIQSVIYKNKISSLLKAVHGIVNSIRVCKDNGILLHGVMEYGDASPERMLSENEVNVISSLMPEGMEFRYVYFGFNSGTAKGHNMMAETCTEEYIMIMNPDIILAPACLLELLAPFDRDGVGMVEARQTPLEHAKFYDEETGETEWASTACTVFKNAIFKEINGFDADTFFMYCDDLDFSWRLRLQGYKIIYNPKAVVYHAKNLSLNASWLPTQAEIYYSAEAALLLAYKWSNYARVKKILKQFEQQGGESEKKAAAEFRKRKEENRLPVPIDPEHKIGKFIEDEYCEMRFSVR